MSFYLNIECSKDLDSLKINFSDGTSTVVESPPKKKNEPNESKDPQTQPDFSSNYTPRNKQEAFLDLDEDYGVSQEIVEKPKIDLGNRDVKVADEVQNLEI